MYPFVILSSVLFTNNLLFMPIATWFTFLMKKEPLHKVQNIQWVMDERKCLNTIEIQKLRKSCTSARACGLRREKFTSVYPFRTMWTTIPLKLRDGLVLDVGA